MTYILIFIGVAIALTGFIVLARKLNITTQETNSMRLILDVINYVNRTLPEWKYSGDLDKVVSYVLFTLNTVDLAQDVTDISVLKKLVLEEAQSICALNGIKIDADFLRLLNTIIDIVITKEIAPIE